MTYTCSTLASPVGELKLVANGSRLAAILWENDKPGRVRLGPMSEAPDNPILLRTAQQLREYFAGGAIISSWIWSLSARSSRKRSGQRC
jgi:methylated-DNA-[protein]-cysteine S-methyltransferase